MKRKQDGKGKGGRKGKGNVEEKSDFDDGGNKKRRIEELRCLHTLKSFGLSSLVDGRKVPSIIDTGATSSVIASRHTHGRDLDKKDVKPIRVGDDSVQWSLGSTFVDVLVGQEKMRQRVLVMETTALDLILGMDFLSHESVEGILFRPYARLVVNGKEYPLEEMKEEIIGCGRCG